MPNQCQKCRAILSPRHTTAICPYCLDKMQERFVQRDRKRSTPMAKMTEERLEVLRKMPDGPRMYGPNTWLCRNAVVQELLDHIDAQKAEIEAQAKEDDWMQKEIERLAAEIKHLQEYEINCSHAKSDMTPCVSRDGKLAVGNNGLCVGCQQHPADILTALVLKYVKQKAEIQQQADELAQLLSESAVHYKIGEQQAERIEELERGAHAMAERYSQLGATCKELEAVVEKRKSSFTDLLALMCREQGYVHWEGNGVGYLWSKVIKWTREAAEKAKEGQ